MNSIQRRGEIAGPDVIVMGFESIEPQGNEINGAATPSYGYGCHARQHHLVCFKEGFIDRNSGLEISRDRNALRQAPKNCLSAPDLESILLTQIPQNIIAAISALNVSAGMSVITESLGG